MYPAAHCQLSNLPAKPNFLLTLGNLPDPCNILEQ